MNSYSHHLEACIDRLEEAEFGYTLVESGFSSNDFSNLAEISIERNLDLNEFGPLDDLEEKILFFLKEIGLNEEGKCKQIARKIDTIAKEVIRAAKRETGWVCLRAATPNTLYDLARWHIDGTYFSSSQETQFKWIVTLIGDSTYFYPLPISSLELRKIIWIHMGNRLFLHQLCNQDLIVRPERGVAVLFIAGTQKRGALHSEPPISRSRLVFSVVPCSDAQLPQIKEKVARFYQNRVSVYDR